MTEQAHELHPRRTRQHRGEAVLDYHGMGGVEDYLGNPDVAGIWNRLDPREGHEAVGRGGTGKVLRFGFLESGVGAMALLPMALWPLGEVERAVSLELDADARNAALPHAGARAHGKGVVAMFELMRGDLSRAAANGVELVRLSHEHDLSLVLGLGVFLEGAARAESGAAADGLEQMRRGELLRGTNFPSYDGVIKIALAQAEARAGDVDRAIAILDEALATVQRTGCRAFEAELNRVRGEMLLERDPASPAPAEEVFRTAVAIARQQAARSFELRAALALAKLYQSTGRPADAYAVLAPALEGFPALERLAPRYPPGRRDGDEGPAGRDTASDALIPDPSPKWERGAVAAELPEIAEAQALLAALAEMHEVRAATAQRQRRGQLLVAYGNALIGQRGWARRKRWKPSPEPATTWWGTRARRSGWLSTTACGPAAFCAASFQR